MSDQDLYQYFKIEAREIVSDLSRDILGLEKDGAGAEPLARLLRQAHTLKGAARVVRLPRIAEIAHAMEDALAPHRGSPDAVSKEQIGRLLPADRYNFVRDKRARPAAGGRYYAAPDGA